MSALSLPALPYADWEPTKTTLHLWCQIVGKIRLRNTPHRNHWWNVTLHPTVRGLSTLRMRSGARFFEIELDFVDHRCIVRTGSAGEAAGFGLTDGLSVAEFYRQLVATLERLGIDAPIVAKPYGVPMTTPFAEDREHHHYDADAVRRWWEIVVWTADVFDEFGGEFLGKESPTHLFWHAFDLALGRYSGRPAGGPPRADPVQAEAYSREVIAFGFWPGDANTPAPTYYTYTAPEPASLTTWTLRPAQAAWYPSGNGHLGGFPYDVVRAAADPRAVLLDFLRSGYEAGTRSAHWDVDPLRDDFARRTS